MKSEQIEINISDENIREYTQLWIETNLNAASIDQFHIILDGNNDNFDKAVSAAILNQFIIEAVEVQIDRMKESGELPKEEENTISIPVITNENA